MIPQLLRRTKVLRNNELNKTNSYWFKNISVSTRTVGMSACVPYNHTMKIFPTHLGNDYFYMRQQRSHL